MYKKLLAVVMCICLLSFVGCSKNTDTLSVDNGDEPEAPSSPTETVKSVLNPLTGLADISADKADDRAVAIMVNNIVTAQPVQNGLDKADIVYETEVEGGITRLMAVYQDVSKVERIGSVRSARYPYVDLAMGHNAIYVHHGQDPIYCAPHLKDTDDVTLSEKNYGARIKNGLASEHTLYAYGDRLWQGLVNDGWKTANSNASAWQSFAPEGTQVSLSAAAGSVTVPFSASYKTTMNYDAATGTYIRSFNGTVRKDYTSGNTENFKNVFVLLTTIRNYPDGKHRQVFLTSGSGYYFVNGTYTQINWSKGNASDSIKFTNTDGTPLTVNAGNSWVCIADMNTSQPIIG